MMVRTNRWITRCLIFASLIVLPWIAASQTIDFTKVEVGTPKFARLIDGWGVSSDGGYLLIVTELSQDSLLEQRLHRYDSLDRLRWSKPLPQRRNSYLNSAFIVQFEAGIIVYANREHGYQRGGSATDFESLIFDGEGNYLETNYSPFFEANPVSVLSAVAYTDSSAVVVGKGGGTGTFIAEVDFRARRKG